jgi:tetratricopeptide (TPR) repeat protein
MPDSAHAYCALGIALGAQEKRAEAFTAFQKAIDLRPDFADAHWNLGVNLRNQGRFAESLAAAKRARELGSRKPDWPASRAQFIRRAELFVELDARLPKILRGEIQPRDAVERINLAEFCSFYLPEPRRRYAAAAQFYADAFAAHPKLAETLSRPHRSNAASTAMMAALGQGLDASQLDEKERARLRGQALDWLRADLATWRRALEKDAAKIGPVLAEHLRGDLLRGDDFAVLRDEAALPRLPAEEREAWRKLRADVKELLTRAEGKAPRAHEVIGAERRQ